MIDHKNRKKKEPLNSIQIIFIFFIIILTICVDMLSTTALIVTTLLVISFSIGYFIKWTKK